MASAIAREVFETVVFPSVTGEHSSIETEEVDLRELRELQYEGLLARVELEALFAAGLVTH